MYVIAGSTGRVGSATAQRLLSEGAQVRVLVRRQSDAEKWEARGAEARIVQLVDQERLGEALDGCEGFFVLLPFDLTVDDLDAHADALIRSIAGAVDQQRIPHTVMLSSAGADLAQGTGPIAGLHRLEQALLSTGTRLTALRSGHFQEKIADVMGIVQDTGVYPVFAESADVQLPMVATSDLGDAAASALLRPPASSEMVDIIGPSYSERELASMLGDALERQLQVATLPESEWKGALENAGFRPHIAESLVELYLADSQGLLTARGDRSVLAPTRMERTVSQLLGLNVGA